MHDGLFRAACAVPALEPPVLYVVSAIHGGRPTAAYSAALKSASKPLSTRNYAARFAGY